MGFSLVFSAPHLQKKNKDLDWFCTTYTFRVKELEVFLLIDQDIPGSSYYDPMAGIASM